MTVRPAAWSSLGGVSAPVSASAGQETGSDSLAKAESEARKFSGEKLPRPNKGVI